jgi:hypothetical protein
MIPRQRVPEPPPMAGLMAAMAAGDGGALFAFVAAFGDHLARVVRRHLFELGRREVGHDESSLDFLVQSAALAIFDRAAGWSPEGAPPWVWADRAIRAEVVAFVGHPSVEFDAGAHDAGACTGSVAGQAAISRAAGGDGGAPSGREDFDAMAERFLQVALLRDAIARVGSPRDQAVHIQYRIQKRSGDTSPAHTVAAEFGLAPDNVRQIDHRMRRKLRCLIDAEERYDSLRTLGWLAA